ncbi:hypothetical protein ACIBCR_15300 [Micromonospora echinospora]|uniref:hypothetical protein n=1 Tax=Micromonospora echinospora TaxID=1877 RepID=UPI00379BA7E4
MTTTSKPYTLDTNGFPAIPCPRCDGRGNLPHYSKVFQGTCFKCDGSRYIYPTKGIATAAKEARNQLAAGNPTPELLDDIARAAERCRVSYDRTLARRETRAATAPAKPVDTEVSSAIATIRDILTDDDLDNIEKATCIHRLTGQRFTATTPAARRFWNDIARIQDGWNPTRGGMPQHLDIIAIRVDNQGSSK